MSQKKDEGILFSAEIRVVGSYTDGLLRSLEAYDRRVSGSLQASKGTMSRTSSLFWQM